LGIFLEDVVDFSGDPYIYLEDVEDFPLMKMLKKDFPLMKMYFYI